MSGTSSHRRRPTVAVVGGGPAGLAAAVRAAQQGLHVELFERRKHLGGRAGSFWDPIAGRLVDHCGHVAMGCCTNLADFCRRTDVADCFRRYARLHFFGPEGIRHDLFASRLLPAPLHLLPGLMRLRYLSAGERWGIARTLSKLVRKPLGADQDAETIGAWLRRHGQSDRAIRRFWSVVVVSALSETVDRASLTAARQVFLEGFLASRRAYQLEVPLRPLQEIFDRRVGTWLTDHAVKTQRGTHIERIEGNAGRATALVLPDGTRREFDFFIVAVPWQHVRTLFPQAMPAVMPALAGVGHLQPAPITAVHLWFDHPITRLPHAVLVDRLSQWVFRGGEDTLAESGRPAHYCQVVISASGELSGRPRRDLVAAVRRELESLWPEIRQAQLLHWRVSTNASAVFSARPGVDRFRPGQRTPIENVMLAGDWTATGWPATMEGAVRSGYLAVQCVMESLGAEEGLLAPDLPRNRLTRWLCGLPFPSSV